jgi:ankyrin repeat protein
MNTRQIVIKLFGYALALVLVSPVGCTGRSKEQQREISAIEQRVESNPASVNADTGNGTPLDVAVINNYYELAQWLVDHHADVNGRDNRGETVLHRAVISDRAPDYQMIRLLLRNGADVNARRQDQETPLHVAASLGITGAVRVLLEHGAQVDATTARGETPLHMASSAGGKTEVIELLLAHRANIEARANNGATPLHQAIVGGRLDLVDLLLKKGANLEAKTSFGGETPLHIAARGGQGAIAELLLEHQAEVNVLNEEAHTPLWCALHAPGITASATYSGPIDTTAVAEVLRRHGGIE